MLYETMATLPTEGDWLWLLKPRAAADGVDVFYVREPVFLR
jgi:hypothetical protein